MSEPAGRHCCDPPVRDLTVSLPAVFGKVADVVAGTRPDGVRGDLWRCDCRRLWQVARALPERPGTVVQSNLEWQPATPWQRLRHRRSR